MRATLALLLILFSLNNFGQLNFHRYDSVQVVEENGALNFPWAGGLNHSRFSNMDFDDDGTDDLLVFDKSGDGILCLRWNASNELEIAPEYRAMFTDQHNVFKSRLHDWILLHDFNADGKSDIFTYSNGGMAYYKGGTSGLVMNDITDRNVVGRFELNLYPNPNNGAFTIEPHMAMAGNVELRVFDMLGQQVWTGTTSNLIRHAIDLSELQNGIYLMDVRSENKMAVKRFIIQH
jgi:hypothetical protein